MDNNDTRAYLKIPFRLKSARIPAAARQKFLEISRYSSAFLTSLRSKPEPFTSKVNFEIGYTFAYKHRSNIGDFPRLRVKVPIFIFVSVRVMVSVILLPLVQPR